MATFLDLGFLEFFLPIFTTIFVFALAYGMLTKTKFLSESNNVNAVAAITVAIIVLLTKDVVDLVNFLTPWFVIIFLMVFMIFLVLMFAGKKQEEILPHLGGPTFIVIVSILLLVIVIGNVFQGVFSPYKTDSSGQQTTTGGETIKTIFHPRVLGAIVILVISAIAVRQITENVGVTKK